VAFICDVNAGCAPALPLTEKERAMVQRRRFKQKLSFQDRLASFAKTARKAAALLPPGAEKDELLRKALRADTAAHLSEWSDSPGLKPSK
jgi:hypothetical protein